MRITHKRRAAGERPIEVAMTVLLDGPFYIFEKRPDDKDAGAANMIAAYGGQIEWGEMADEAAVREMGEETNLTLKREWLRRLGMVEVMSDRDNRAREVHAHAFEAMLPGGTRVKPKGKAGKPVSIIHQDLKSTEGFSPATGATIRKVYLEDD